MGRESGSQKRQLQLIIIFCIFLLLSLLYQHWTRVEVLTKQFIHVIEDEITSSSYFNQSETQIGINDSPHNKWQENSSASISSTRKGNDINGKVPLFYGINGVGLPLTPTQRKESIIIPLQSQTKSTTNNEKMVESSTSMKEATSQRSGNGMRSAGATAESKGKFDQLPIHRKKSNTLKTLKTTETPETEVRISEELLSKNVFLPHVLSHIKDANDIVLFTGHSVKRMFGENGPDSADVKLTGKVKVRTWKDVASLVNQSVIERQKISENLPVKAVHVYNEHKLGDVLEFIILQHKKSQSAKKSAPSTQRVGNFLNKDEFHAAMDLNQPQIFITNSMDENWGFFSTGIGTRTTKWINMTNHLRIHNANYENVKHFLDSPKILFVVCNTHVDPMIGAHEKIISFPLGIRDKEKLFRKMVEISSKNITKTRLLLINNSGWGDRAKINAQVIQAFNNTIQNMYSKDKIAKGDEDHYYQTARSKFVLSPSGLGFDTYRLWETILLGSIPVVESNSGFDRTYSNLPVLVVSNYNQLTPTLLEKMYPCFVAHAHRFRYSHLTLKYWLQLTKKAVETGNIDHVTENHPFKNPYCNIL